MQGIFGIGGEVWGEIAVAVQSPDEPLTPAHVTPAMKGKIVVGGSFLPSETMTKAKEVGVAGLVIGAACGLANGVLIAYLGLPAFVVTYGMMWITQGFALLFMKAEIIYGFPKAFLNRSPSTLFLYGM